ncbi:3-phosphoglycerate dehydrogenase [Bosea caraganae]|uniref:3-phosphoglycerate dehydrogenase n=1 Tax=Bosea caraganae TaxID=2763117 RepID=A0A370L789_9HYPH|nr:2-hydroxyacid dehydrogenase [Bosea caraganae]RDJ25503.1 3-phosphoglycerate dehydrogenase [Bosea caraganae]RDJ25710.1 3-phosphoglycerate dehydrogenase [Bosea caraganae]
MTETIVVLDPMTPERADKLRALLPPGMALTHGTARGDEHLKEIIEHADYAIAGQVGVSGDVLRAARKLKLLHKWGVGIDNLDVETARSLGIRVARTTGSNAIPVAEFTLGLMLSALRFISYGHAELKQGEWRGGRLPGETFMLSGKTVGIVGFGAIGMNVARLLQGFGCKILYSKRQPLDAGEEAALGVRHASLPDLLAQSDIVSLHCPLTPETANMIDKAAFAAMKKTAVLINVARGGVVVEPDLVDALRSGEIHAAAMDVFSVEPLPADSPLLTLDNLVVTPHLAAIAADNFAKTVNQMFGNILCVSRGEAVPARDLVA